METVLIPLMTQHLYIKRLANTRLGIIFNVTVGAANNSTIAVLFYLYVFVFHSLNIYVKELEREGGRWENIKLISG